MTAEFTDKLLSNIVKTGFLKSFQGSKGMVLSLLAISLLGAKGRKKENLQLKTALKYLGGGLCIYWASGLIFFISLQMEMMAIFYMVITVIGYITIITGGTLLTRIIRKKLDDKDIFNKENETFPQEERLLENEFSINLPAKYFLKGKQRNSWINIINPFRGTVVLGSPGSGKSYFVIRHIITQHIAKGFSMFVYDFKFDDLSVIVYNHFLKNKDRYPPNTKFYVINFDDLSRSHRCNPLDPHSMTDITDAAESARTILMGLNRE